MEKFLIPPEDCLILKAFKETQSLREAAILLQCDPAGLTRRVQHISSEYGLIQKVNNRWQLTSSGMDLVAWTDISIQSQKKTLSGKSSLRFATTMWLAEEVLIPKIGKLKKLFDENTHLTVTVPNKNFELSLIDGSVDFVIACHPPENPEIEHKKLADEEWVLIAPAAWKLKKTSSINELKDRPFIRHSEMNTDLFIPEISEFVKDSGVSFDNLIGIRSAVKGGLGWSVVPRPLVQEYIESNIFSEIHYDFTMSDRKVCIWWLRNRYDVRKLSVKVSHWVKEALAR